MTGYTLIYIYIHIFIKTKVNIWIGEIGDLWLIRGGLKTILDSFESERPSLTT